MRHQLNIKKLGRTSSHRLATLRSLAIELLIHKRIQTTKAKAKALRPFVEPIITRAKENTLHNRSLIWSKLLNKGAIKTLFDDIMPMIKERPGGYTRIVKSGYRQGDGADMAYIELVDYNNTSTDSIKSQKDSGAAKRKRTRRSSRTKLKSTL